jgi:hypothetical protein
MAHLMWFWSKLKHYHSHWGKKTEIQDWVSGLVHCLAFEYRICFLLQVKEGRHILYGLERALFE